MDKIMFRRIWAESLEELSDTDRLQVYDAIMMYAFRGKLTDFNSIIAKTAFRWIKRNLDDDAKKREDISMKRKMAGQKGGAPKNNRNALKKTVEEKTPPKPTTKVKTPKHKYAPLVLLTEDEYAKLVSDYGEEGTQWMVKKLDDYKAASGRTYKSDYRAILNWVVKEYEKRGISQQCASAMAKQVRDGEFARHIAEKLSS